MLSQEPRELLAAARIENSAHFGLHLVAGNTLAVFEHVALAEDTEQPTVAIDDEDRIGHLQRGIGRRRALEAAVR